MKADFGDLIYWVITALVWLIMVTFISHNPESPMVKAARLEKLAEDQAFCLEQAARLPLAWDEKNEWCIVSDSKIVIVRGR